MENFGIKKFERFDYKKYNKQKATNLIQDSKAKLSIKENKADNFKIKGSLSDEKWDHLHTEESFHPNSVEDNIEILAESFQNSIKPKRKNLIKKLRLLKKS